MNFFQQYLYEKVILFKKIPKFEYSIILRAEMGEIIFYKEQHTIPPDYFHEATHIVQVVKKGAKNSNRPNETIAYRELKNNSEYHASITAVNSARNPRYYVFKGSWEECLAFLDRER